MYGLKALPNLGKKNGSIFSFKRRVFASRSFDRDFNPL